jgi:branched-chain amino acid transport system substrate-binding protein
MRYHRLFVASAVFFMSTATWIAHAQGKRIVIGVVAPTSGGMAAFGQDVVRGAELALEKFKTTETELGGKVEWFVEDSKSDSKSADAAARKLLKEKRVDVVIAGVMGSSVFSLSKITGEANRPIIAATATNSDLPAMNQLIVRAAASDADQGRAAAKFAMTQLSKKKLYVLYDSTSSAAKAAADAFDKSATKLGATVAGKKEFVRGQSNFKTLAAEIKSADADAVFVAGYYNEAARFIDAAKEQALRSTIIGSDGWDSPRLSALASKSALKGPHFLTQFSSQDGDATTKAFVQAYREKHKVDPTLMAAQGFDAALLALDAFKRAGTGFGPSYLTALTTTSPVEGAVGLFSVGANRSGKRNWVVMQTTSSNAKFLSRVSADE